VEIRRLSDEPLRLQVNGTWHRVSASHPLRLLDVLRDDLGLTGTKEGCSVGVCGLCAVTVDGELMSACLVLADTVAGSAITTIEGMADSDGALSRLQDAFIEHGGFQCGICTPGQVMAAAALLSENPAPDVSEVREWMAGSLCRCTGYQQIVEAVMAAGEGSTARP
jgi:carbon-monoxide dehydrogenase small subunit